MQIKDMIPWAHRSDTPAGKQSDENPVAKLQGDMNRMFQDFWSRFESGLGAASLPSEAWGARADVVETDGAVEVSIELPGMTLEDLDVSITHDTLTVKGEKKVERRDEKKGYYVSERSYGSVFRTIPLPPGVDADQADASFKDGVLTVKLPQTEAAKAQVKRVSVKPA